MLSNDAVKLLKWMENHDKWMTPGKIKDNCKAFDDGAFKSLIAGKMVNARLTENGDSWVEYRISDYGKAYLEDLRAKRLPEVRDWINALLPILTFLGGLLVSDPVKAFFRWFWDWVN